MAFAVVALAIAVVVVAAPAFQFAKFASVLARALAAPSAFAIVDVVAKSCAAMSASALVVVWRLQSTPGQALVVAVSSA